jgi:hypothetical protein
MKLISQVFIDFVRKNKQIEILAYLVQNYLGINYQGWGTFAENPENIHEHFKEIAENYVTKLSPEAFKGKIILELGTGFSRSGMLHLIKEYQVKHIYCYDKFNCLIDDEMHLIKKAGLESYLDRVTFIVGNYEKIINEIGENKVDTVVSNAVLEFVDDLDSLAHTLYTVMKVGSLSFHRVDLKCHNKFRSLGQLYFHTFSDTLWRSMGQRVGQLNRKLKKDYIKVFSTHSFECEAQDFGVFSSEILDDATSYLPSIFIEDYKTSELDLFLIKK